MGFFKRKQHPLPKFPDHVIPTFQALCESVPVDSLSTVSNDLLVYVNVVREQSLEHQHVNIELADALIAGCQKMLEAYPSLDEKLQGYVVGALRYFVHNEDGVGDMAFGSGFDDDAKVINFVLEEIGVEGFFVDPRDYI